VIQLLILRTPTGFAEETGLGEGNETKWVLTPQEARMLTVAIRREKVQGRIDVLSRPRLTLADNQTGFFQVGQPAQQLSTVVQTAAGTAHQPVAYTDGGIVSRMTPRINPDGTVLLRGETQVSTVNPVSVDLGGGTRARAVDTQSIETAGLIPKGGALVVRGGRSKAADGGVTEVMLVLTADRVQAQPAK
jgi:type II secretory pathway component GspD/PulD (secretin)